MRFTRLADWLRWQETLHPRVIDLGLERVAEVARRLDLPSTLPPLVTVAGTNGKGTTVAALEALFRATGRHPGCYTSPHLRRYNERIRLAGEEASDARIMAAFDAIDRARGDISLSYFEFGTLAALWCVRDAGCDVGVLEVGLGGRLDAVNAVDPAVSVITRVDLDHADMLGPDRESIGREKAGILRPGRAAVCADPQPPASVLEAARRLDAPLYRPGHGFQVDEHADGRWTWTGFGRRIVDLPAPAGGDTARQNLVGALAALAVFDRGRLPEDDLIRGVVAGLRVPARLMPLTRRPGWLLDVAHNPAAAAALARELRRHGGSGRRHAVFGLMRRKDLAGILHEMMPVVDVWHLLELPDADAWPVEALREAVTAAGGRIGNIGPAPALLARVAAEQQPGERVVALGSFRVAEEVLRWHDAVVPA
jgi:dihydrofolate synthase/folylpolyglutamate synthase